MQPITRETLVDRRQPAIRWSAVFAGTAVAVGLWGVLQVLGLGAGLAALDPDVAESARTAALGTGAWSVVAPLLALFVGGFVAARLANSFDRRVAGSHALVMWGLTATAGLMFTLSMAASFTAGVTRHQDMRGAADMRGDGMHRDGRMHSRIGGDIYGDARAALLPINNRLEQQGKPQITPEQLIAAIRLATDDGEVAPEDLAKQLAAQTALSRDEAKVVVTELSPDVSVLASTVTRVTPAEHDAMTAAETAGKGMLALGISILIGIGTALLGALLAVRRLDRDRLDRTSPQPPIVTGA